MDRKIKALWYIFLSFMILLATVQMKICLIDGEEYTKSVVSQRSHSIVIKEHRGKFFDRNMIPIVENSAFEIAIGDEKGTEKNDVHFIKRYGDNHTACHLIGYIDREGKGVSGLEKVFDTYLRGKIYDRVNVLKSANGKIIGGAGMRYVGGLSSPDSVVLTIDSHIQDIAQNALLNDGASGAVVVLDVSSFDVLAMASTPLYERDDISKYIKGGTSEFINRCIWPYNAGSVFKIVTLCAGLENNALANSYFCDGKVEKWGHIFHCHKEDGHGKLNPKEALSNSCNCAFYNIGEALGAEKILNMAKSFGFGSSLVALTGFDEASGYIPEKQKYMPLDSLNYAIGQGEIMLTPLQIANMTAIIANGGVGQKINVAEKIIDISGNTKRSIREWGETRVVKESTAEVVKNAMIMAGKEGTAKALKDSPLKIAGKTGTAETGWIEDGQNMVHGWFCGFFPYDNPKYAMAVLVENGGSGAMSALPIFNTIANEIVKIYPLG